MNYATLSIVFLLPPLVVAVIAWRAAPRRHAAALAATGAVLLLLTAVFDSIMIAAGLFGYTESQLIGLKVGLAPIEDFAYPIAALLLCTAIWNLGSRRARRTPDPDRILDPDRTPDPDRQPDPEGAR